MIPRAAQMKREFRDIEESQTHCIVVKAIGLSCRYIVHVLQSQKMKNRGCVSTILLQDKAIMAYFSTIHEP